MARMKLEMFHQFQNSGYDESGASRNKNSMRGWRASSRSPQEDIDQNLPLLRQRSRSLYMSVCTGRRSSGCARPDPYLNIPVRSPGRDMSPNHAAAASPDIFVRFPYESPFRSVHAAGRRKSQICISQQGLFVTLPHRQPYRHRYMLLYYSIVLLKKDQACFCRK